MTTASRHPCGTVELVRAHVSVGFDGQSAEQDYELTWGAWKEVAGLSANGYWRPESAPVADFEHVTRTGRLMCRNVTDNQPSFVGCYETREEFVRFIEFYLRGRIIESVLVSP